MKEEVTKDALNFCSFSEVQFAYIYRPQRSCEGYVFTGLYLSTGGGGREWYPSMPCNRSRGGGGAGPGGCLVWGGGCLVQGVSPPWEVSAPGELPSREGGCLLQGGLLMGGGGGCWYPSMH